MCMAKSLVNIKFTCSTFQISHNLLFIVAILIEICQSIRYVIWKAYNEMLVVLRIPADVPSHFVVRTSGSPILKLSFHYMLFDIQNISNLLTCI